MPMTPKEKYETDASYHALVDHMVKFIQGCEFTPSEMREAAVLASIICEQNRIGPSIVIPDRQIDNLNSLNGCLNKEAP